jgi:hypothetical protein
MTEAEVFTQLPCLSGCTDWRADKLRCRLGRFYLLSLAGQKPAVPPLAEMMANCCKVEPVNTITYIVPQYRGKASPFPWER